MRDIKFRAWDVEKQYMFNPPFIRQSQNSEYAGEVFETIQFAVENEDFGLLFEDVELMQYTGLKDKDDVSIYEGDIVEAKCHECEHKHVFEICYMEDVCAFGIKDHKQKVRTTMYNDTGMAIDIDRVIGNIYENPELLK